MKIGIYNFDDNIIGKLGLDATNILIIDWLIRFINNGKMVTRYIDGELFYWINYESLIRDLCSTGLKTKDSVYRRLKKIVDRRLMKHKVIKEGGSYSFYDFNEEIKNLVKDNIESYIINLHIYGKEVVDTENDEHSSIKDRNSSIWDSNPSIDDSSLSSSDNKRRIMYRNLTKFNENPTNFPENISKMDNNPTKKDGKSEQNILINDKYNKFFVETSNEFQLAKYLLSRILINNPKIKKPNLQQWSQYFDYMIRVDNRHIGDTRDVIDF